MCHRQEMKWGSAISEEAVLERAVSEAGNAVRDRLGQSRADLVLAFVSPHYAGAYPQPPELVAAQVPRALLLRCSPDRGTGARHDVEQRAAFSLTVPSPP